MQVSGSSAAAAAIKGVSARQALTRIWSFVSRGHGLPLAVLLLLQILMLRDLLFTSGLPAWMDSGFLYSRLPFFDRHEMHIFSVWLPEPFGQVQQYSVYWLLASFEGVFHNPIAVYKGAVFTTIATGSIGAYGLAFWLTRSRLAAGVAAGLYVFAPFSVSIWLLGHLDVGIAYAVGPFAVWALWVSLRTGHLSSMIALGLTGSALFLLTTGQGLYWLLPLLAITVFEVRRTPGRAERRATRSRLRMTLVFSGLTFLFASAVQVLPYLAGLKAPFVGGQSHYYIEQLSVHAKYSLPFLENVVGIPQSKQYLAPGITLAAAAFDSPFYWFISLTMLAIGLTALATKHRPTAVILLVPTVCAWLLASGPHGPIRPLYLLLYHHLPYFSLLRVPNRWLMVSTLGLAMLTALTIAGLRGEEAPGKWLGRRQNPGTRVAIWVMWLGLFASAYGLFHGLPTQRLPADYREAYTALNSDPADWRILTTPYYQAWMQTDGRDASPLVYKADIGETSTFLHGRATLDRGGWDARSSRFARYLSEVVKQGTSRSITKLLGAVGVKYLALNPQAAIEVPGRQNAFFDQQAGLRTYAHRGKVTIYRNDYALPQAFVTPTSCIVAGGLQVLGDLAEQPSFRFDRIGLRFADQIAATGGPNALSDALANSSCLIVAPGGDQALAALLVAEDKKDLSPVAPGSWIRGETSPILDIGSDPSVTVSVPPGRRLRSSLHASQAGQYEIWLAGLRAAGQSRVGLEVDKRDLGSVDFSASAGAGIRWLSSGPISLTKGNHTVQVTNLGPPSAPDAQLTKIALIDPAAAGGIVSTVPNLRVMRERGGAGPIDASSLQVGRSLARSRWRADPAPGYVTVVPQGASGLAIQVVRSGRRFFTLARVRAATGISTNHPFALRFKGTGSGQTYYLKALFDDRGQEAAWFKFKDTTKTDRMVVFSPLQPSSVSALPDWSAVKSFTIACNAKTRLPGALKLDGPFELTGSNLKPSFEGTGRAVGLFAGAPPGQPALAPPTQAVNDHATLSSPLKGGLLVFTQTYHPRWKLQAHQGSGSHSIALGFANSYSLDGPLIGGSVRFTGARYGRIGTWISLVAWVLALGFLLRVFSRSRSPSNSRKRKEGVRNER
jgi:hypothetical protein